MNTRMLVNGLAVIGGMTLLGLMLSPMASLAVYTPYLPGVDLFKIRGHELLKLVFQKDTEEKKSEGAPFPVALRFSLFDQKGSFIEDVYTGATGKKWSLT